MKILSETTPTFKKISTTEAAESTEVLKDNLIFF